MGLQVLVNVVKPIKNLGPQTAFRPSTSFDVGVNQTMRCTTQRDHRPNDLDIAISSDAILRDVLLGDVSLEKVILGDVILGNAISFTATFG